MKRLLPIVLVSALAVTVGCASTSKSSKASAAPVNRNCPVMNEHPVREKNTPTVSWKGQTVGFCCADCIDEWKKLSDAEKEKALAAAK